MVINKLPAEMLAAQFEAQEIPAGTPLTYSDMTIRNNVGQEQSIMRDGLFMGYDAVGAQQNIIVQRRDPEGQPYGHPKIIPISCLRTLVETVELESGVEPVSEATSYKGIFTYIHSRRHNLI